MPCGSETYPWSFGERAAVGANTVTRHAQLPRKTPHRHRPSLRAPPPAQGVYTARVVGARVAVGPRQPFALLASGTFETAEAEDGAASPCGWLWTKGKGPRGGTKGKSWVCFGVG